MSKPLTESTARRRWLSGATVALAGLLFAVACGCQMGPTASSKEKTPTASMPDPFFPKEWVHFFPSRDEVEYKLTDDAQAAVTAKQVAAARANHVDHEH